MEPNTTMFPPYPEKPEYEKCCVSDSCETVGTQFADINIPLEITPTAVIGKIETECCGDPIICCRETSSCKSAEITITQKICIKIPIEYCTEACVGPVGIKCCDDYDRKDCDH